MSESAHNPGNYYPWTRSVRDVEDETIRYVRVAQSKTGRLLFDDITPDVKQLMLERLLISRRYQEGGVILHLWVEASGAEHVDDITDRIAALARLGLQGEETEK